jgi:hypothetical protein
VIEDNPPLFLGAAGGHIAAAAVLAQAIAGPSVKAAVGSRAAGNTTGIQKVADINPNGAATLSANISASAPPRSGAKRGGLQHFHSA